MREGEVEIRVLLTCPCSFLCIYSNENEMSFSCYCPPNKTLAKDGLTCQPLPLETEPPTKLVLVSMASFGLLIFLIIVGIGLYLVITHFKRKRTKGLEMLTNTELQLDLLRGQGMMVSEYNPNYDFGASLCTMRELPDVKRDKLRLLRALGQGAFGEVYEGLLVKGNEDNSDMSVAVKTLPALSTDQAEMDFLMEALIMSKFDHPNIVKFIGVCFEKHPRFIVLELLEGGDLKMFLRDNRPKQEHKTEMTMVQLLNLAIDVAKGCEYLEDNHFIHRDIAARNCLLTTKNSNRIAKIADFGMSRDIYRSDYYRKGGRAMLPVKWMPPEAFLDGIFTSKTDVWSYGILLWEVFAMGYMPYPGLGNQEVMQFVTAGGRLDPPQNCPLVVYNIMTSCWHGVDERRPSFTEILKKLDAALQDPGVLKATLPVVQRPVTIEKETTSLTQPSIVQASVSLNNNQAGYLEPDSPTSVDQLIHSGGSFEMDLDKLKKRKQQSQTTAIPSAGKNTASIAKISAKPSGGTDPNSPIKYQQGHLAMAARKPAVNYRSPESEQSSVEPSHIMPSSESDDGAYKVMRGPHRNVWNKKIENAGPLAGQHSVPAQAYTNLDYSNPHLLADPWVLKPEYENVSPKSRAGLKADDKTVSIDNLEDDECIDPLVDTPSTSSGSVQSEPGDSGVVVNLRKKTHPQTNSSIYRTDNSNKK